MEYYQRKEDYVHSHGTKKECHQCTTLIKEEIYGTVERNMQPHEPLEEINTFSKKHRIWKRRDSGENDYLERQAEREKEKEAARKRQEEYEKKVKELREKHRKQTRAKKAVHKKSRKPNPPSKSSQKAKEEKAPVITEEKRPPAQPATKEELEGYEVPDIPHKAPTYHNRILHALRPEVKSDKERIKRTKSLYLKFPHRHFHLYTRNKERAESTSKLQSIDSGMKTEEEMLEIRKDHERIKTKHKPAENREEIHEYQKYLKYLY